MQHLLVFSHLRWNFFYQRPQHLLSRLARHFEVLFVEEPLLSQGEPWMAAGHVAPGVTVLKPHTSIAAPGFHDDQLSQLQALIEAHLHEHGVEDYLAWLTTPMALPLLAGLSPRAVVFDCMDELSALPDAPRQLRQREAALLKVADLVLAAGPSLHQSRIGSNPNLMCLPNGVDAWHYAPDNATSNIAAMLDAQRIQGRIVGPRLGYFGVIDERLDLALVAALADADPNWQLVMAGPVVKIDPTSLPQRPNIHWLGAQPYTLLPQLVADWDVCLQPFVLNESTRFINPTNTLEYMAAEKPVVSTPVHDVVAMYGDILRIGHSHEAFIDGCRWALSESALKRSERVTEMHAAVALHSWDNAARIVREALFRLLDACPPDASGMSTTQATASQPGTPARARVADVRGVLANVT